MVANPRLGISVGGDDPDQSILGAMLGCIHHDVTIYGDEKRIREIGARYPEGDWHRKLLIVNFQGPAEVNFRLALSDLRDGSIHALITGLKSESVVRAIICERMRQEDAPMPGLMIPLPRSRAKGGERDCVYLIDGGATNRMDKPEVFLGWAKYGSEMVRRLDGHNHIEDTGYPRVALHGIAKELDRAHPALRKIHDFLAQEWQPAWGDFVHILEPKHYILNRQADLVLTEGLLGNSGLKDAEAFLQLAGQVIGEELAELGHREAASEVLLILRRLLSYDAYLVSPLVGTKGWIFRVHGSADELMIAKAIELVASQYPITSPI